MNRVFKLSQRSFFQKDTNCLLILAVFIFLLVLPVIVCGVPDGYDLIQHYQFAVTYHDAIKSGNYLIGWAANTNGGFGDVGIRFYPPLSHYFLAVVQLFTGDWVTTTSLSIYFWMLIGSIGSYFWAREWHPPHNALLVGLLYAVAPYHLTQFYQYFLYSEFAAAGILPFTFLFLTEALRDGKMRSYLWLSVAVSLLVLTHIPTTVVGTICLALYALVLIDWKDLRRTVPKLSAAAALTLIMTSFYWLRFLSEVTWVSHYSERFSTGYYDYQRYLFPLLYNSEEIYFARLMWAQDIVSIFTILLFLPFVVLILYRVRQKKDVSRAQLATLVTGLVPLFMASRLSSFVWENLELLQKIQFPWRWLSIATLFVALAFVTAITHPDLAGHNFKRTRIYALVAFFLALSLYNLTQVILPAAHLSRPIFEEKIVGLASEESFDCWWTSWANRQAFKQRERVLAGNRAVRIIEWQGESRLFEVAAGDPVATRIATFYYPRWKASINGQPVEIERTDTGLISIPIPGHAVEVRIYFEESRSVTASYYLAALTWLLVLLLLILSYLPYSQLCAPNQKHAK